MRTWLLWGAVNGFLAVAAGAFGAHGLKKILAPDMLEVFQTAARYQMFHALALVAAALLAQSRPSGVLDAAGGAFVMGVVLFSGSLYALSLTGITRLGIITPFGGLAFLAGWVLLGVAAYRAGP